MCVVPFKKRAERGRPTPHNYESTPVDPLRHGGIISSTEAPKLVVTVVSVGAKFAVSQLSKVTLAPVDIYLSARCP